jgi:hypothetical protein
VYHHVVKRLFSLHVRDTDCDFRFIRHTLLDKVHLRSTSGVICVEMMRSFERVGAQYVEVGVSHFHRPHGKSQFFRLPAIARSARQLLQLWWRRATAPTASLDLRSESCGRGRTAFELRRCGHRRR